MWKEANLSRQQVKMFERLRQFWKPEDGIADTEGATATEYAVMLALIIAACLTAITALGTRVCQLFPDLSTVI